MSYVRYYNMNTTVEVPFRVQLNFKKLIAWWEEQAKTTDSLYSILAKEILKQIENTPDLRSSFESPECIEKFHKEIQLLLSPFFPSLTTTNEIKVAGMPFHPIYFNPTTRFSNIIETAEGEIDFPNSSDSQFVYMYGCIAILNLFYGANINFNPLQFFNIPNKKTGILRRYKALFNADFAEIVPLKKIKHLTQKDIKELTDNFGNIELWKQKIPPDSYSFEGFNIITLFEVTREESISALKFDLLKKDALLMPDVVERIRINLSALLNIPNIKTGIIFYEQEGNSLECKGYGFCNSILLMNNQEIVEDAFCQEWKLGVYKPKEPLILSEINEETAKQNVLAQELKKIGVQSYMAVPLLYNEEIIGFLELSSDEPNALNAVTKHKLQDVIPLFTTALQRSLEERQNQLEAIIRQKYTAIHPTVAWRFTEAAENLLERQRNQDDDTLEDIVFENVYPLYGQADIQGSSDERNHAIQADLIEQLLLANQILETAVNKFGLPIYKELQFRINTFIDKLQEGLTAGDENTVFEFLKEEIYPVFKYLNTADSDVQNAVQAYKQQLDPQLDMVYKERKAYDQSVRLINETIATYLDEMQQAAQNMFPHYFEKYKTDGVEHNLYIGESMVKSKTYHPLFLRNLRLWQLLITCEIENVIQRTKPLLKKDLNICSLILVHSNPLNIHFSMEEKKFDVDGTYNIRYEIIKKRIDKATIKETNERLTQKGKLVIIYSNDREIMEYVHYLHYLQSINYIESEIEWVTLNDLQGVTGLKALRVNIIYQQNFEGIKDSKAAKVLEAVS
ncbi:GAF domain-containing protein [Chitinophagaceae bacterium LB-8]|uniref:GAF domain-containing protein n=1 Tax=Paraflavisolibacter caeni TaxID=2982496 RepID=A0A9X2XPC7_9BACT|nr:GAF domain-containing protein [Paraflavisolibacter caeni]MCU7550978.1 GAF domain-containing protein [Paraflavisolibacter caeni]